MSIYDKQDKMSEALDELQESVKAEYSPGETVWPKEEEWTPPEPLVWPKLETQADMEVRHIRKERHLSKLLGQAHLELEELHKAWRELKVENEELKRRS